MKHTLNSLLVWWCCFKFGEIKLVVFEQPPNENFCMRWGCQRRTQSLCKLKWWLYWTIITSNSHRIKLNKWALCCCHLDSMIRHGSKVRWRTWPKPGPSKGQQRWHCTWLQNVYEKKTCELNRCQCLRKRNMSWCAWSGPSSAWPLKTKFQACKVSAMCSKLVDNLGFLWSWSKWKIEIIFTFFARPKGYTFPSLLRRGICKTYTLQKIFDILDAACGNEPKYDFVHLPKRGQVWKTRGKWELWVSEMQSETRGWQCVTVSWRFSLLWPALRLILDPAQEVKNMVDWPLWTSLMKRVVKAVYTDWCGWVILERFLESKALESPTFRALQSCWAHKFTMRLLSKCFAQETSDHLSVPWMSCRSQEFSLLYSGHRRCLGRGTNDLCPVLSVLSA